MIGVLDEEQTPSLVKFTSQADLRASLDMVHTLNSALNSALNAIMCYVSIAWSVAD